MPPLDRRRFLGTWAAGSLWIAGGLAGPALRAAERPRAALPPWAPKLFAYCVDNADAKHRALPEQAALLCELGYAGTGYPLWFGEQLGASLKVLDAAALPLVIAWTNVNVHAGPKAFDARLPDAFRKLKGRGVTVCVLLSGYKPGDRAGNEPAAKVLRELGDLAAASDLRISIYNHAGNWTESVVHALEVVKLADHPRVGVNFNLCHWLKVEPHRDYRPVIRENVERIFVVTINGAQLGSPAWTNGLIQPLDRGDFDNRALLATLRDAGYRGPIGLMCYGVPGDAREHLQRSMNVWKSWQ